MKFPVSILLTILLAFAFGLYLPWWTIAVAAFVVALLIRQRPGLSFLTGFIAVFVLWGLIAWTLTASNHHILAPKVATILPLGGSVILLVLITAFVGGLVSGAAGLTGALLRRSLEPSLSA